MTVAGPRDVLIESLLDVAEPEWRGYTGEWETNARLHGGALLDAVLSDEHFNDVIRVLGGKVAGLDRGLRVTYGSSVLFKQGRDLYDD